jgi:hypothetical protein
MSQNVFIVTVISVDSELWRVRAYNDAYANITQRASGVTRTRHAARRRDNGDTRPHRAGGAHSWTTHGGNN